MHEHAATRLFVFPVAGRRRWAFIAKPPSLLQPRSAQQPVAAPSSALYGGSDLGSGTASTPKPQGYWASLVDMSKELWSKATNASNSSDRVEIVTDYLADKMHDQWVKLEVAPERSWKKRVHNWGTMLLSRIRASEVLFKTMPKKAPGVEIVYPAGLSPELVRRRVRLLAKGGEAYHQRWLYGATAVLPFTMVLGVLPVPNLPFFWNVFRIHAHWSAMRGSRRLLNLTTVPPAEDEDGSTKHDKGPAGRRLELVESEELAKLTSRCRDGTPMADGTISDVCKSLELDPHLVAKWRDQK